MARKVLGVLLCLVGAVWFFQGVNVLKGSFMTGEPLWAVIGAVCVVFGVTLLRSARQ